ncbi:MAG: PadR family transcriptional regulator [Paenibacillaceae bacterium]|jgi:DNA-binding PadR family transcriptional regulator|nr:PadR family transcriptional regulator [Paenibacillaceae bacterium]
MLNYIVLGMLFNGRLTGYDVKKWIENGIGVFYKASYGSIYPTLKLLLDQKLVSLCPEEESSSRQKKLYEITPQGREAFLHWLSEPIEADDSGGKQSHLAKVYFFDVLPEDIAERQLVEYERKNALYLNRLLALERSFDSPANHQQHYYKMSTLYYGIGIMRETLRWCRHARMKLPFRELYEGGESDDRNEESNPSH